MDLTTDKHVSPTPSLLGLTPHIRARILRHLLSTTENRVREKTIWRPLHAREMETMADHSVDPLKYRHKTERERGQTGRVANVKCSLDPAILRVCRKLYHEGRKILVKENKFIAINGWTRHHERELAKIANIPMWKMPPRETKIGVALRGLIPRIPNGIEPVLSLNNDTYSFDDTVLIHLRDFSRVCQAHHLLRLSQKSPDQLVLRFPLRPDGMAPQDFDFERRQQVSHYLSLSVVEYLYPFVTAIYLGPHKLNPQGMTGDEVGRELNGLERSLVQIVDPASSDTIQKTRYIFMATASAELVRRTDQLLASGQYEKAIPGFYRIKELTHRLGYEERDWYEAQDARTVSNMRGMFIDACTSLSIYIDADDHEDNEANRVNARDEVPGPGPLQWAYIHTRLAIQAKTSWRLQVNVAEDAIQRFFVPMHIRIAKLKYFLRHSDRSIADSLLEACEIMAKLVYPGTVHATDAGALEWAFVYLQQDDEEDWDGRALAESIPPSQTRYCGPMRTVRPGPYRERIEDTHPGRSLEQWETKIDLVTRFYLDRVLGLTNTQVSQ